MFALIENQQITKHISGNKGITIGDVQYPRSIFTLWSEAERNAIGIYIPLFIFFISCIYCYFKNANCISFSFTP